MDSKDLETIAQWRGADVVDRDGDKIGTLEDIYLDQRSDEAEWALVKTGLFGGRGNFVPLTGAQPDGDNMRVSYSKERVKDAPKIDPDGELSPEEEMQLYRHYGLDYGSPGSGSGTTEAPQGDDATHGEATRGDADSGDAGTGGTRLRRYVVTEEVRDGEVQSSRREPLG